jgi:hypothetical protein
MNIPNITAPYSYCVTDKADGDRHLMYISNSGKIYLINTNMDVIFTGAKTEEERCFNTLIDGELILHNKLGTFINTFAAFDIYVASGVSIRERPFIQVPTRDEKMFRDGCRLPILKDIIRMLKAVSIVSPRYDKDEDKSKSISKIDEQFKSAKLKSPMTFVTKNFYPLFLEHDDDESLKREKGRLPYSVFKASNE